MSENFITFNCILRRRSATRVLGQAKQELTPFYIEIVSKFSFFKIV